MRRFELVRVVITKDDTNGLRVGETYCAIKDRMEFAKGLMFNFILCLLDNIQFNICSL